MSTLFAFLHHLCAFTLVSAIAIEFALIRQELTLASARKLQATDRMLGIAAGALLIVRLLRVFYFEKGPDYYFHSQAFMAKFSIFVAVGLLSIIPTLEFLSWRKLLSAGQVPAVSAKKTQARHRRDPWRAVEHSPHPALRGHHGARRLGLAVAPACCSRLHA